VLFTFSRVVEGMGPALTMPNGLAVLGKSYPPGERKDMSFAWFGAAAPFGAVVGFAFGRLFAHVRWPWIYWSHAITLAGIAVFAAWTIPQSAVTPPAADRTYRDMFDALDIPGGVTGVAALVLFDFSWNQAFVVTWKQPYV
jgi:MFS family permease